MMANESGGNLRGVSLTSEEFQALQIVRQLIDRLELYGQTVNDNQAFVLSGKCWGVFAGVALLNGVRTQDVLDVVEKDFDTAFDLDHVCNHIKVACPAHNGSWDCNSFCKWCEGEQEICEHIAKSVKSVED